VDIEALCTNILKKSEGISLNAIQLSQLILSSVEKEEKKGALFPIRREYKKLSREIEKSSIQTASCVRNVLKARWLVHEVIEDNGDIHLHKAEECLKELQEHLYSLRPACGHDAPYDEHIVHVLTLLCQDKKYLQKLRHVTRPLTNKLGEEMIRDSLLLDEDTLVTDAHARRAVLMAALVYLRQSLGSCFATAPSIMVQKEQKEQLLSDLDEMMSTGALKRTFEGVEYSVPMSSSWGNGDLLRPLVIREHDKGADLFNAISPSLIKALQQDEEDISYKERKKRIHTELLKALSLLDKKGPYILTNSKELLELYLLSTHGITYKDLKKYEEKPKAMHMGSLMFHVSKSSCFKKGKHNPCELFLEDLARAKRCFKAQQDCALLKAWEFTVASFSEIKLSFARFNLYQSLGVNYDQKGGIGECLYTNISRRLEEVNREVKELDEQYEDVFVHVRYLETRLRQASTEQEMQWVKVEYRSRKADATHIEQLRRKAHGKAQKFANLYNVLIQIYDQQFFNHFQEVYDPEIHDIAQHSFDDSPAGFRLLYKHGRSNPSLWTRLFSLSDFIEALVSFFTLTEQEVMQYEEVAGIETEVSYLITQLISWVRGDEFLESAFHRIQTAHEIVPVKDPLQHLDQIEVKPWVYNSGGSMSILTQAYFRRSEPPKEAARWVESETELLAFLLENLKQLPPKERDLFSNHSERSLLMHSPTHAFLLRPGAALFQEGWKSEFYTYSWIKQKFIEPRQQFFHELSIEREGEKIILEELLQKTPKDFQPRLKELFKVLPISSSIKDFRHFLLHTIVEDRGMKRVISEDEIDSVLYSSLPFISSHAAEKTILMIAGKVLEQEEVERIAEAARKLVSLFTTRSFLSSKELRALIQASIAMGIGSVRHKKDLSHMVIKEMREEKLLAPAPLIFADTNWVEQYFAFVINPGSEELELWGVDYYGVTGQNISSWKKWLNGSRHTPEWGIFTNPYEYSMA